MDNSGGITLEIRNNLLSCLTCVSRVINARAAGNDKTEMIEIIILEIMAGENSCHKEAVQVN